MMPQEERRRVAEPYIGLPARAGFKPVGSSSRTRNGTNGGALIPRGDEDAAYSSYELSNPKLPRKAPAELITLVSVPQTDSGGRVEHTKALERSLSKELGKLAP